MGPHSELIAEINKQLKIQYGVVEDHPRYRVVWSTDQLEQRLVTHTPEGLELARPIVMEVPKYKQWNPDVYIMEKFYGVPETAVTDLVGKVSYESVWTFRDQNGEALIPIYAACRFLVEVIENQAKGYQTRYKDSNEREKEENELEMKKLAEVLYGNETKLGDDLAYGRAISLSSKSKE